MSTEYVLGNDAEELARLKLQHDLWKSELVRLWEISKIKSANQILDLGCGPGFTTMDLAIYLNKPCEITSIDISENFLNYLNSRSKNLGPGQKITTQKTFIEELDLPNKNFDAAFCRWLMIFVQDPPRAIESIAKHLKPKAQFVLQEYVSYDSMDLVPDTKMMRPIVDAIFKSWKAQGGDPNRGKHLPMWLEKAGFKITHLEPIAKFARPNDPLWLWPESFYKSFLPRLEKAGFLTALQIQDFFSEWNESKNKPGTYFIAPTVINIIAEKNN